MSSGKRSFNDMTSQWISDMVSGMPFFWWSCIGIALWIAWNTLVPPGLRFDPPPGYVLLLTILNIGQWLFLSALGNNQRVLQRSNDAREAENDQILRNQLATMKALEVLINKDLSLAHQAEMRLIGIEEDLRNGN